MKFRWAILVLLAVVTSAHAQSRTFSSKDGSKRFEATLLAYREKDQLVTVRMKGRPNPINFQIGVLSEEDQSYVKEQAQSLRAGNALKLSFERYRKKDENADARKYIGGYEVVLRNLAPEQYPMSLYEITRQPVFQFP